MPTDTPISAERIAELRERAVRRQGFDSYDLTRDLLNTIELAAIAVTPFKAVAALVQEARERASFIRVYGSAAARETEDAGLIEKLADALTSRALSSPGLREAIDIVFDGPPGPEAGRFVEVETLDGKSVSAGEWIERSDGYWVLRIPVDAMLFAALNAISAAGPHMENPRNEYGWLPDEENSDKCFNLGLDYGLSQSGDLARGAIRSRLSALPESGGAAFDGPVECAARKQSLPEPAECDWPHCGCDPHANRVIAAFEESGADWQPMESAPKNRETPVLLRFKDNLSQYEGHKGARLERWAGLQFVGVHDGITPGEYDMGWRFAAPVGQGGFPDAWFVGWKPLDARKV